MVSWVPAVIAFILTAAYFFGVDSTPQVALVRHCALLVVGLWLVAVSLKKAKGEERLESKPAAKAKAPVAAPGVSTAAAQAPLKPAVVRDGRDVLGFLGLMQEKGRLIDFLMDDVSRYGDAQVGAAARVVHQGASAALKEYFEIKPVATAEEGSPLTLASDYDAHSYRLIGRVVGEPPYRGHLLHRGWLATSVKLPEVRPGLNTTSGGVNIITPAEVELN